MSDVFKIPITLSASRTADNSGLVTTIASLQAASAFLKPSSTPAGQSIKTYSNFSLPKHKSSLLLTTPEKITMIDFVNNEVIENIFLGEFLNHNSRYPCYIVDNNLYYISGFDNLSIKSYDLTQLDSDEIQKNVYPLISNTAESKPLKVVLIGFASLLFFWIMMKLFVYQDHIKGLILYDKSGAYYRKRFISMSPVEINFCVCINAK